MSTELIERFYSAFAALDGDTMAACYTPDARFSDPVFTDLTGAEPGQMWQMLTSRAKNFSVELLEHDSNGERGTAHWVADYDYAASGRRVHNDVRAELRFAGDKIAEHRDSFSLYGWARQALGPPGLVLGWSPILHGQIRKKARGQLDAYIAAR